MTTNKSLIVAAIDFGTTYSGYAYSWITDYERDPLQIYTNRWNNGNSLDTMISYKTSTSILFKEDGTFHSFGFEADNDYQEQAEEETHEGWRYFRRFKLELQQQKKLRRNLKLKDDQGKPMKALNVFGESIRYLRQRLFQVLTSRSSNINVKESNIYWVLTVPAIWQDNAKQFMKEAAEYAGLDLGRFTLALEPEAAAVYYMYKELNVRNQSTKGTEASLPTFPPGLQYMLVDLGGGTADVTVHEIQSDGSLREIVPPSGGPMGGDLVNLAFEKFINDLFHPDVMEKLKQEDKNDHLDFFGSFEIKKRDSRGNTIILHFPRAISDTFYEKYNQGLEEYVNKRWSEKGVSIQKDKLRLKRNVFLNFFSEVKENIVGHLKMLCANDKLRNVKTIIMVGGFSECKEVSSAIEKAFPGYTVGIPEEAGLAVLKGAVLIGRNPDAIRSRKMRYTYGISTAVPFDQTKHLKVHMVTKDGRPYCEDVFTIFVKQGQNMARDGFVEHTFNASSTRPVIEVYRSTNEDPKYVNDEDCTRIGKLEICPIRELTKQDRIKVKLQFGQTMITVSAEEEKTKQKIEAYFNLLGDC